MIESALGASMKVAEALRDGASRLRAAAVDNPRLEARLLLAHALGRPSSDLVGMLAAEVPTTAYDALIARRTRHEPLALILGRREFWSLEFSVSTATLVPRADSETLVEAALADFAGRSPPTRVLDLGTGTGCLLLAVLHEFPSAFGIGVDIGPAAAALAAGNAERLGFASRTAFLCGDWAAALSGRFGLILSNPPYVASAAIQSLMPEVSRHEPPAALDGGTDGLQAYRRIIPALPALLAPDGIAVLELGQGQAEAVAATAAAAGFGSDLRNDLGGTARAIVLRLPCA
ncbi:MAG TPA: peptide chain release factor N(5)-glutamine methyltransferase [Acetobacteraceae bacterium]|nr:peptide chain release factor N(5)-glutamine methyltransferase [Acetobacteraceae bacterium]